MRVKEATHGAGLDLKEASGLQVKGHNAVFPRQQVANVAGWSGRTSMQDLHDASSRPELSHGKLFSKYHYLASGLGMVRFLQRSLVWVASASYVAPRRTLPKRRA